MKIRAGFVSNSSSTAYYITNLTDRQLTLVDFVKENPQIIEEFREEFDWYKEENGFNQEELLLSAQEENLTFEPQNQHYVTFGDEDGTLVGNVFDYALRDGGESESFRWRFAESLR